MGDFDINIDFWASLKHFADNETVAFDISYEYAQVLLLKQKSLCALSGNKIINPGVDSTLYRKNNEAGFVIDNVVWALKDSLADTKFTTSNISINMSPVIALSGGFDCPHKGHYRMFKDASELADVVAIVNSDEWLLRKKGYIFMNFEERKEILESCKYIRLVVKADDDDNTVCKSLEKIRPNYFGNGGDRKSENTPETVVCNNLGIELVWNVGGEKIQSSSDLVRNSKHEAGNIRK